MRFLLISDTHGKLGVIDELATKVRADAVIHAGDFGEVLLMQINWPL
jgi:predicted phosphodiesterase